MMRAALLVAPPQRLRVLNREVGHLVVTFLRSDNPPSIVPVSLPVVPLDCPPEGDHWSIT